jgi:quinol monooxygenase YgiN
MMYIVLVYVKVKKDEIENFRKATLENAQNSLLEPGVARFDVVQEMEDPTRFVLVEAYFTPEDAAKHKDTDHYLRWRDTVADMMAEPRRSVKYVGVFPDEAGWKNGA